MRRIDQNKIKADADWDQKARAAQQQIDSGELEAKDANKIWSETKTRLKAVSAGKCWYCETREDRSDDAVDHFRPKSLYPQFACDIKNFRYACTFCNSIRKNPETGENEGKGNHFPLLSGSPAVNDLERLREDYLLIDPCVAGDPSLLDFKDDGFPCAKYPKQEKRNRRAVESIKFYHLDHPDLNEARRQIALQIRDWVDGAELAYNQLDQDDASSHQQFSIYAESICRAIATDAPFSVFARKMVKGFSDRPFIEELLDCA